MKTKLMFAAAGLVALTGVSFAATQGTAGSTSTATVNVNAQGPAIPRQVQVLNVADINFDNNSRSERGVGRPGSTMQFCLVDTYGGDVNLTLSTNNPVSTARNSWQLAASGGQLITYSATLTRADMTSLSGGTSNVNPSFAVPVSGAFTVPNTSACGSGNMKIHLDLETDMPQTIPARNYLDTITMVASPI